MKNKDIRYNLDHAIDIASRSTIKSFLTGAVIASRDKRVASGFSLPSVGWSHYSERTLVNYRSIHAELHAILRCHREDLAGASIFIATIRRKSGNVGLAKPCPFCLDLLHEVGISNIYYTVEGEEWEHIKI